MKTTWPLAFLSFASFAASMSFGADAFGAPHYRPLCDEGSLPGGKRCHGMILADENDVPIRAAAPSGLGATDLEAAYHLPTTGGNGKIIASVLGVHYPNAEADLNAYRTQYGLPPCTKANGCFLQVDGKGGTNYPANGTCNGVAGESALDIQMLSAGCPDCKIMLIEPNGESDTQAITMAIGKGVVGLSFSFCGGENGTMNEESAWNHPGTGLFASSGDWGYLSHEVAGQPNVCSPASHTGVFSVGGTTLMKSNTPRGWTEQVWSHAGSGCSTVIPKPAWQTDTTCKMKMVADLSAIAENVANYCTDPGGGRGGWGTVGGTSASSPFVAGALAVTGVLDGHFNPSWVWEHANQFYDITSGNNGTCGGAAPYYCQGTTGYDGPTGVGSPNGDLISGGSDAGRPGNDAAGVDASVHDAGRDVSAPVDAATTGSGGATTGAGGSGTTGTATGSGSGGDTTGSGAGGSSSSSGSGSTTTTTGGPGGSSATSSGSGGARPTTPASATDSGCSCRSAGAPAPRDRTTVLWAGALAALATLAVRTGRRRARASCSRPIAPRG